MYNDDEDVMMSVETWYEKDSRVCVCVLEMICLLNIEVLLFF